MIKLSFIDEPELEFGAGKHIDIRFGLRNFGPLDIEDSKAPKAINVGIVGTPETIEGAVAWFDECRQGITAKTSNQPFLFSDFPGFIADRNLHSCIFSSGNVQNSIPSRALKLLKGAPNGKMVEQAVELFLTEIENLSTKNVQVIVCAPPLSLLQLLKPRDRYEDEPSRSSADASTDATDGVDFHDLLKARAMTFGRPLQLILPSTYDESKRPFQRRKRIQRASQDKATRAWNFHVAMYYKAGGIPWRLVRRSDAYTACYIGISFYESLDRSRLLTSVAQVFNERGEGMAVRGAAGYVDKIDRQIHLKGEDAYRLVDKALKAYTTEHHHQPARVVIHKSSASSDGELDGFLAAAEHHNVHSADILSLYSPSVRLFRVGAYPPLRGTFLTMGEDSAILYTKGSVNFFETYPGMYVPQTLGIRFDDVEEGPLSLGAEILALTKMNWNNTQFDGYEPITLVASRKVGRILKYAPDDDMKIQSRYSFYM
jgi:hypothetical protein